MSKFIFSERESKFVEFKLKVPKFDALLKTCVAFANAAGGRIIIGVDDVTHEVVGVSEEDLKRVHEGFSNSLYGCSQSLFDSANL